MARVLEASDPTIESGNETTKAAGTAPAPAIVVARGACGAATAAVVALLLVLVASGSSKAEPWRADSNNTQGWQLMTPEERIAHQARIRSLKDTASCRAYQLQHHALMQDRARQQGRNLAGAQRDFCAQFESRKASP